MLDRSDHLFVYGTLMPGLHNHHRIAGHVRCSRAGTAQGVLLDLGSFPALVRGNGIVRGILLDVNDESIRITDFIEGYHGDSGHSLYVREKVKVHLDDGNINEAWTYFFARPDQIKDRPQLKIGESDGIPVFAWERE